MATATSTGLMELSENLPADSCLSGYMISIIDVPYLKDKNNTKVKTGMVAQAYKLSTHDAEPEDHPEVSSSLGYRRGLHHETNLKYGRAGIKNINQRKTFRKCLSCKTWARKDGYLHYQVINIRIHFTKESHLHLVHLKCSI